MSYGLLIEQAAALGHDVQDSLQSLFSGVKVSIMNVNEDAGSLLQKKHMGSFCAANTWTPQKKIRLSHSEYEIIAHQSIRKIAEYHSEYEIITHQSMRKISEDHNEYEIIAH